MQLTLEALLSGARRMTPLRAQALLEPEDSSSSDFVESPEESSPEVSDSDGGHPSSGPDDRRGAGEASPSLTVTSGASGELDTTGVLAAGPSSPASSPGIGRAACLRGFSLGLAMPRLGASSAELFPSVRVLAYADNVVLVGPLEDAVAATSAMKKYMLADLKLEIQPRESKVYIPSWHQHPDLSQLKKSLKRRLKTQLLHFEVVTGGITLGGLPIGTDGFHASQLRAKVSTLNEELSKLGLVQHGFMFKTLVRASHLQKLRFFLQGSSPFLPRVQSQIRRFDLSVHLALEKYHRWPSSQYLAAHPDLLEFARFKRELPHSRGGDEFTPSEADVPDVALSS
ncbi:hypothetical protein GUITHDRAFT_119839 [Guillardia theta CCMP2712]|uniref:Reverse transcriptase domain-containing protein n=1 Tax=Guillardia theta (strain CCMP2712) TaxID=905079 RepID=L1ICJ7_GUITC|nr:hypothetical protein GUITHDRAFT_119839 [Guillardia theta CCMP2712]EKX33976.1 hypothetical protein GUITHDRAFT_119839 [Guillardia theta CCMP2712]|eukprot:XP_005820956.1 hypothetical protein GUITHDRAFT_119839 [Guillardia theta CCMP2712]